MPSSRLALGLDQRGLKSAAARWPPDEHVARQSNPPDLLGSAAQQWATLSRQGQEQRLHQSPKAPRDLLWRQASSRRRFWCWKEHPACETRARSACEQRGADLAPGVTSSTGRGRAASSGAADAGNGARRRAGRRSTEAAGDARDEAAQAAQSAVTSLTFSERAVEGEGKGKGSFAIPYCGCTRENIAQQKCGASSCKTGARTFSPSPPGPVRRR